MGTRALTWALTLPLVGAGVLVGHDLTYRLVAGSGTELHDYLAHAPQLLAILLLVGLIGLAFEQRTLRVGSDHFVLVGAVVFTAQEHLERLIHNGSLPFLLADRAYLVGMLVQLPIGLACLALARLVTRLLHAPGIRRVHVWAGFWVGLATAPVAPSCAPGRIRLRGRSPPPAFGF